jgi:hypothetical protein
VKFNLSKEEKPSYGFVNPDLKNEKFYLKGLNKAT